MARDTLKSSTTHVCQVFDISRGPGFSPQAIAANTTRPFSYRSTAPANKDHRVLTGCSTLSHGGFAEAFVYDRVVWSVRCRRWKPITRSRTTVGGTKFAHRVHVKTPYSRVSITSAFSMRALRLADPVKTSYSAGPTGLGHA